MNIVRQLLRKHDIQQKQLAIDLGVSNPTVSDWVHNRKDPSGKNLKKLAEYFNVDELVILGSADIGAGQAKLFVPENPKISGKSETEQIIERLLKQLDNQPRTVEARIVSGGMDRMPPEQREQILAGVRAMFPSYFAGGEDDDPS